ncbi:MAG: hypothetical protein EOP00_34240, partial [Pedobacter sp.]
MVKKWDKLTGIWKIKDSTQAGKAFVFDNEGYVYVNTNIADSNRVFLRNGNSVFIVYEVDTNKAPFLLNFIIKDSETKLEIDRLEGIFEFAGNN